MSTVPAPGRASLVLVAACLSLWAVPCLAQSDRFPVISAPYELQAFVDLDGDGVLDHVVARPATAGAAIHLALSARGSVSLKLRKARVLRLTGFDIDDDGDLDLVAATDVGLFMWKNDGHGQFFRVKPGGRSPPPGPSWGPQRLVSVLETAWLTRVIDPVLRPAACGWRPSNVATIAVVVSPRLRTRIHLTDRRLRAPPQLPL